MRKHIICIDCGVPLDEREIKRCKSCRSIHEVDYQKEYIKKYEELHKERRSLLRKGRYHSDVNKRKSVV